MATPSAPHPTANHHRSVTMTCALTGFVMVLVWWGWPAPLDPLTQLLGRIPHFSRLAATASRPFWAFGAEAGLIMGLALLPALLWRRLASPAAWGATGGVLVLVMTAAATFWQTSGVLIQIGAVVLTVLLNALLATVWVRSRSQGGNGNGKYENHLAEKALAPQIDDPIADAPRAPPVLHDEDDAADESMLRNRNPARSAPPVAQQRHAEKIGRYEILRLIGKGAMGEVFLGRDPRINRLTAIKTLRFEDNFAEDEISEIKEKFFREAESAGTLSHADIVTIYDAGEDRDMAFIAMEYLEGVTLLRFTRAKRLLPVRKTIRYVTRIAEALDYAHGCGIVHRDIKPANVMVLKTGAIKLTDFGIARITASSHTQTGVVKGTPYYMSPEQFSGTKVDGRSDIFSLGTMLFQLLTGSLPFFSESPAVLMNQIMNFPHPNPRAINPRVMPAIIPVVDRALEKQADRRYARAGQMAADLAHLDQRIKSYLRRKALVVTAD
ncbi:MAG: serine/threonine-protein kinase [Desulfobacterales bacterium]|nr:serine/threonine-protein kinase [Desulfobacterales bacterium]